MVDSDRDPAERALLALCANPESDHAALYAGFTRLDWERFVCLADEQRVQPLASRALRRSGWTERAPHELVAQLDAAYRWQALYGLKQLASLQRTVALLKDHGIEPIALKGVRLAWGTYPDPALRPLRDLDLLVPREDAERAQALLLDQPDFAYAPWAGRYGLDYDHQLPELVDTAHGVTIEVHHRILLRGWDQEPELLKRMRAEAEPLAIGSHAVRVPSAHVNLLHLIEHATLHHLFDNGPQVLADIHFAVCSGEINWSRFIPEAEALGLIRSLRLVAAVAERNGATWVPAELRGAGVPDEGQCLLAETALLRPDSARRTMAFLRRLEVRTGTASGVRGAIAAALRPDPTKLAQIARTSPTSPARWLAYPLWLLRRARLFVASRSEAARGREQVELLRWLKGSGR